MAQKKKILLVEDDSFMIKILADKIVRNGFEIKTADDGEECLKKLESYKPDLILLDLIMPRVDGYEVLHRLKESQWHDIPVIVLSNLGEKEEIDHALELGAKSFMVKANFTTSEIIEKMNSMLQEKS